MSEPTQHIITKNFTTLRRAYFEDVVQPIFDHVAKTIAPITHTYRIANKIVELNFYNSKLEERMTRALAHLEITNFPPSQGGVGGGRDLTVHLWDSVTTQSPTPMHWSKQETFFETETDSKKHISESFLGIYLGGEETMNFFDAKNSTAYFWIQDAHTLPDWLAAAPIRTILHWFLAESNIHLLHGAVVGVGDQAVLLSAKGGSGKSTTAISSILSGLNYLGDDYVALESGETIIAHSLYNSVKVDDRTLEQFPELIPHVINPEHDHENKSILFFHKLFPNRIQSTAKLAAIMIPRIVENGPTRIVPASKLQAMIALSPTTLFQLPLAAHDKLSAFKSIIETTPCYFLELGLPMTDVPNVLKEFLTRFISSEARDLRTNSNAREDFSRWSK